MAFIKNDKIFRDLRKKIGELADMKVKVGVLEGDEEVETEHGDLTISELAAIHEFGAPAANIPERSFIRASLATPEGREAAAEFQAEQAKEIIAGTLTAKTALKRIGAWGVARVRKRIKDRIDPPLQPATIRRKGSSTPLVDTGHLSNSVTWEIDEAKGGEE